MKKLKFVLLLLITMATVQNTYSKEYSRFTEEYVGEVKYKEIDIILSFYSSLFEENGTEGLDACGNELTWSTIAIPYDLDLGTKIEIDYYPNQIFVGNDRGSKKHIRIKEDGTYRIDLFVPRKQNEDDYTYKTRVNSYGKVSTKGRIIIE